MIGICSRSAPRDWNIRLTLAFCSANPNCRPRNPKHMFQICANVRTGLDALVSTAVPRMSEQGGWLPAALPADQGSAADHVNLRRRDVGAIERAGLAAPS